MNRELLTRPFEPHQIKQRPGQHGKTLSYVDVTAVIARLNEACEAWSFEIVSHEIQDGEAVVVGKLTADGIVKMAFGGAGLTFDKEGTVLSLADDLKSAASDALKKAASLLGVGLELYGGQPAHEPERPKTLPSVPLGERVTTRQLAAIHGASRRRGLTRENLVALVQRSAGKADVAELSKTEASMMPVGRTPGTLAAWGWGTSGGWALVCAWSRWPAGRTKLDRPGQRAAMPSATGGRARCGAPKTAARAAPAARAALAAIRRPPIAQATEVTTARGALAALTARPISAAAASGSAASAATTAATAGATQSRAT